MEGSLGCDFAPDQGRRRPTGYLEWSRESTSPPTRRPAAGGHHAAPDRPGGASGRQHQISDCRSRTSSSFLPTISVTRTSPIAATFGRRISTSSRALPISFPRLRAISKRVSRPTRRRRSPASGSKPNQSSLAHKARRSSIRTSIDDSRLPHEKPSLPPK